MAKMTAADKKAFLARMAAGRKSSGAKPRAGAKSYRIHNDASGADLGVYRGSSPSAAIKAMLRDAGHKGAPSPNLRATLVKSAGGYSAGRVKSAGQLRSYVVEDERTERVLGTYRAASPSAAITACMRRHPGHSRANLSAHVMPSKAGRVTGRKITRKPARKASKRRAGSAAMVHAGAAMPARKGRQSGAMGTGTPVARLQRVESAVMDLARANHAVVSKVVEHERRLNTMETTLSNWAKGRR
jgi:hypothetical protein